MPRILIVDDDDDIRALLSRFLEKHGFDVEGCASGAEMDARLARSGFQLIILDVMLPDEDGFSICRRIREAQQTPVIMLTGVAETTDRIVGLELGADDYVTKPFDARELLARVRAVIRRTSASPKTAEPGFVLRFSGWSLDILKRELRSSDHTLTPLSTGEFDLLVTFAQHPQRVLTREQLIDLARGRYHDAFDRSIDVQVSRLRRKIEEDPSDPDIIRTVRNVGYIFSTQVQRS
ncbi:response regulator [Luteibacter yeojuensis]|uniref:Chemotaxis protein CheY n=1 Tax=Luteibacter yeojuensis TaxID=345309 RepID=A0A0F3KYG5_9GAMM|nr:response regulator [Luteibacter yeojuensis]KJV36258.1 chemotaxis protein CheY [Luteibacter yeojuensis]